MHCKLHVGNLFYLLILIVSRETNHRIKINFLYSIVQFQKISILPHGRFFCFAPPIPPRNSSLASYMNFASQTLTFKTKLPLGISINDLPLDGYGFFLELHIILNNSWKDCHQYTCTGMHIFCLETVFLRLQVNSIIFIVFQGDTTKCNSGTKQIGKQF